MAWKVDPCPHCGKPVEVYTTESIPVEYDGRTQHVNPHGEGVWTLLPCGHHVDHVELNHNTGRVTFTVRKEHYEP